MAKFDFSTGESQTYSLHCKNNSEATWTFYVYQKMPNQPSEVFSLAWFASPFKISPGTHIQFQWSIDYSFVWADTGTLQPGVSFNAGSNQPCTPSGSNETTFSLINGAPQLSPSTPSRDQEGSLIIQESDTVPNLMYSTGIGMSGQGTFVQQALQNTKQTYTPEPIYYIAAGNQVQMGQVLTSTVTMDAEVKFPPNVYNLTATLGKNNEWTIVS